jgi:hypothetical protein
MVFDPYVSNDIKEYIKRNTMEKYNPYVSTLTPELKEEIRLKHKFEYIPEIEDRINEQNEKLKLIGGYHYSLACKECRNDLTSQDRKDLDYILRKHNYKSEIRSYTPTDSYMIKLK